MSCIIIQITCWKTLYRYKNDFAPNNNPNLWLNINKSEIENKPKKDTNIMFFTHKHCLINPNTRWSFYNQHDSLVIENSLDYIILKSIIIFPKFYFIKDIENMNWYIDIHYYYSKSRLINQNVMVKWIDFCYIVNFILIIKLYWYESLFCCFIMDNMGANVISHVMEAFNTIISIFYKYLPPHSSHLLQRKIFSSFLIQ